MNPQIRGLLIYDKAAMQRTCSRQRTCSPINCLETGTSQAEGHWTSSASPTKLTEIQLFTSSPSFAGSSDDGPPAVSHAQKILLNFSSLFLPWQHLAAGPKETEIHSTWMQTCIVLKLSPWYVLRRPSSCQLCTEPGLWADQAGPALVRETGLSPSAGKLGIAGLTHSV